MPIVAKRFFLEAQKRAREELDRQQDNCAKTALQPHREAHSAKTALLRDQVVRERQTLVGQQEKQRQALQKDWRTRNAERQAAIAEFKT